MSGQEVSSPQCFTNRELEAFAEVVGRYSGLVYGTALRITGNAVDAEDVSQECFLKLARRTDALPDSLSAWLHRVTVNLALNHERSVLRRKQRERVAARDERSKATSAPDWKEISPHLDEALESLPDNLREPVIMHFLQERTQTDVAAQLDVDQATVSRRIKTGIELIRARFKKMGIILSSVVLVAALKQSAAMAAPAGVVMALTSTAGTGLLAGGVAGSAAGTASGGVTTIGGLSLMKLSIIALVVAGTLTAGGVIAQQMMKDNEPLPKVEVTQAPVVEQSALPEQTPIVVEPILPDVKYAGVVVDIEGKPIEGVLVRSTWTWDKMTTDDMTSLATTTEVETWTDGGGHFTLGPLTGINPKLGMRTLLFLHPDYSVGAFNDRGTRPDLIGDLRIALTGPAEIAGRVVDEQERPIADATVSATLQCLQSCATPPYDKIWDKANNEGLFSLTQANGLAVTTDEAGYFRFRNLPQGIRAAVSVCHPDYLPTSTRDLVRSSTFLVRTGEESLELVMQRGCKIAGRLTENGRPFLLKGVPVFAEGSSRAKTLTDDAGRFLLTGLQPGHYTVYAPLSIGAAEFPCRPESNVVTALDAPTPEIKLERTEMILVSGRVVDIARNVGMSNELVSAFFVVENRGIMIRRTVTDANGAYRMMLPPGRYSLSTSGYDRGESRTVMKTVEISHEIAPRDVDLTGEFRPAITGRLVDSDGRPVQGTIRHLDLGLGIVTTDREGRFEIRKPRSSEMVCFAFDRDKQLGRTFLWTPDQDKLEVTLLPMATLTGAVKDENGKPIPDAGVDISVRMYEGFASFRPSLWNVTLNTDGTFRIHPVPLGRPLILEASCPENSTRRNIAEDELRPGEVLEAGTAILERPKKEYTAMLCGRLIDADGSPVIGASIHVNDGVGNRNDTSDIHGRFVLGRLPADSQVSIRVSLSDRQGRLEASYNFVLQTGRDDHVLHLPAVGGKAD